MDPIAVSKAEIRMKASIRQSHVLAVQFGMIAYS